MPAHLAKELHFDKSALSQLKRKGRVEYSSVFNKIVEKIGANREYVLKGSGDKFINHVQDKQCNPYKIKKGRP